MHKYVSEGKTTNLPTSFTALCRDALYDGECWVVRCFIINTFSPLTNLDLEDTIQ